MMTRWLDSYAAELEIVERPKETTEAEPVPVTVRDVPCCARIRTVDWFTGWCCLPDGHPGDHHGVTSAELGISDYSKGRRK